MNPGTETQDIRIAGNTTLENDILPVTSIEKADIVPQPTQERIPSGSILQTIVACSGIQTVVGRVTLDPVVTGSCQDVSNCPDDRAITS
jgi:hypothetical protein